MYLLAIAVALLLTACDQPPDQTAMKENGVKSAIAGENTSPSIEISESQRVNAFFERVFEDSVARSPESLSFLGRKDRADEWNDLSEDYANKSLALAKAQLAELNAFDRSKLDESTALSYDLLVQSMEDEIADNKWRLYNYPVNQMYGRHSSVVSLLINQHRIGDIKDAENYIARLNAVPALFDQLIVNIEARTAANIIPPKFVFPHVIRDISNIIKGAPFDDGEPSALLADFTSKINVLSNNQDS